MKNAPGGFATFLASTNAIWRADLYTLTLLDASIQRWTTADRNLLVGGNTFLSNGAVLGRSNTRQTCKLEVDTLDLELAGTFVLNGKTLMRRSVEGYFDAARLKVDCLVGAYPGDTSIGACGAWFEGPVAGVDPTPQTIRLGVMSELAALNILLPQALIQFNCSHAVYDPNCGLVRATFTLAGSASGVPTTTNVPTTTGVLTAKAAGYFNLGVQVFTSGFLTGVRRAVKTWDGTNFVPQIPWPAAAVAGDTFTVYPGCPRTQPACVNTFNNLVNFRGFPHLPPAEGAS